MNMRTATSEKLLTWAIARHKFNSTSRLFSKTRSFIVFQSTSYSLNQTRTFYKESQDKYLSKDTWREIPLNNVFDEFPLNKNLPELLPGRLFSSRMPRLHDPLRKKLFEDNCERYGLDSVIILTEKHEYAKYARRDIETYYQDNLGLKVTKCPIPDFSIPSYEEYICWVSEITSDIADGSSCLVHCAGGQGRTGLLICGILKHVGAKDPVVQARKINENYVETDSQMDLLNRMTCYVDQVSYKKHPILSTVILMRKLNEVSIAKRDASYDLQEIKDALEMEGIDSTLEYQFQQLIGNDDKYISFTILREILSKLCCNEKNAHTTATLIFNELASSKQGVSYDDFKRALCSVVLKN